MFRGNRGNQSHYFVTLDCVKMVSLDHYYFPMTLLTLIHIQSMKK